MISLQKKLVGFALIFICTNGLILFGFHFLLNIIEWKPLWEGLLYTGATLLVLAISLVVILHSTRRIGFTISLLSGKITNLSRGERDIYFNHSDTEELQEIARAAEILQYELMIREKERRQWTQDITHDLRTPITALKSQLQAIKDGVFPLDSGRYNQLFRELGIIEKMVQDFALLSRIESPEMKMHQHWVLSTRLLESLTNRFLVQAHDLGISLETEADTFYFKVDEDLFLRAASNLIQNAFSYSVKGSFIGICLRIHQNQILFSVENEGTIPEEDLPHIFQRLYRGEKSRTTSGSGLGLTIAKSIAQLHNGDIQARNHGEGRTLFEMTINMNL